MPDLRKDTQRMWDLVRYQRGELLTADLITAEEFSALVVDHPAVARLESYDEMRQRIAALEAETARLKLDFTVADATARMLAHPMKSPFCEHTVNYSYTEDGGKTITCLLCFRDKALGRTK